MRSYDELKDYADKHIRLFELMNKWTRLLQDKKTVISYFTRRNIRKIAIYGFGVVGETLERELRGSCVSIEYFVDKDAEYMYAPSRIIPPQEEFLGVDIMVVTAIDKSGELIADLQQKCSFKVVSIEEIINEV